jgi:hypothetical protein
MLLAMRHIMGSGGRVPATATPKRNVVERMYHQLFQYESRAYGLVRACSVWVDFII